MGDGICSLSEIIEGEARKRTEIPSPRDVKAAEVPHVGIQCLGAGDGQHHRPQQAHRVQGMTGQQAHAMERIKRAQHPGVLHHMPEAKQGQGGKPDNHGGPEYPANGLGALVLDAEQHAENSRGNQRNEHRMMLYPGRFERTQALGSTEHRDGWRDDAVAIEQGRAKKDDEGQAGEPRFGVLRMAKGEQGEYAALAAVVSSGDEKEVFEIYFEHQGPEHERERPEHAGFAVDRRQVRQTLAQGIQRAGADVAKHHPQCPEAERHLGQTARARLCR